MRDAREVARMFYGHGISTACHSVAPCWKCKELASLIERERREAWRTCAEIASRLSPSKNAGRDIYDMIRSAAPQGTFEEGE